MGLVETEGLVLRSYNLSDADKIVVALTEKEGLIRGVAKGAKRLKSKFGGSLEPFSIIHLTYFQKEETELVSIREIELKKSYFSDASDPEFLQKFSYLVDLLAKFAPPHDPNERLYNMAKICLKTGTDQLDQLDSVALYFEYWILKLGGYLPQWNNCVKCSNQLEGGQASSLQLDFNLMCAGCANGRNVQSISASERNLFVGAQKMGPAKFVAFAKTDKADVLQISDILKRIISRVMDREFVSETTLTAKI